MRTMSAHSAVETRIGRKLPWQGSFRRPFRLISLSSGAPPLRKSQQMPSRHEQIRQCRHDEQAIAVLHHAAIADLGTHSRLPAVLLLFPLGQSSVAESLLVGERV